MNLNPGDRFTIEFTFIKSDGEYLILKRRDGMKITLNRIYFDGPVVTYRAPNEPQVGQTWVRGRDDSPFEVKIIWRDGVSVLWEVTKVVGNCYLHVGNRHCTPIDSFKNGWKFVNYD